MGFVAKEIRGAQSRELLLSFVLTTAIGQPLYAAGLTGAYTIGHGAVLGCGCVVRVALA